MSEQYPLDEIDAHGSLFEESTQKTEDIPSRESEIALPKLVLASQQATFAKKRYGRYVLATQTKLKNSLLAGVGLFELANAGDFAANVWNRTPVPVYAIVLMAFGGTLAVSLSCFAIKDVRLSWHNLRLLRAERHRLRRERALRVQEGQIVLDLDTRLDVTFRELGTEMISRFCMNILLGAGAVLVGIGTLLAIGGDNRTVWETSNILSGYLGNFPLTFYTLINGGWCLYIFAMAHKHKAAATKALNGSEATIQLTRHAGNVQKFAAANGITGLIGGFGSMVAVTRWWGYVVLIPVIISSICCNYFWRHRIGYDHSFVEDSLDMGETSLVSEMETIASMQHTLSETFSPSLEKLGLDPQSLASVLDFIVSNDLFEELCTRLLKDTSVSSALFNTSTSDKTLTIDSQTLLLANKTHTPRVLAIAHTCITKDAPRHFLYQERYLSETLGSFLRISHINASQQNQNQSQNQNQKRG